MKIGGLKDKKGISDVIATILIVMITVLAIGIIWVTILPMIRENLAVSDVCENAGISIISSQGYTCYQSNNITMVQVSKANTNVNVTGLTFSISSLGNSYDYDNQKVAYSTLDYNVYYLNTSEFSEIEKVSVVPVIKFGDSEKSCSAISLDDIPLCSSNINLVEVSSGRLIGRSGTGTKGGTLCDDSCSCADSLIIGQNCTNPCGTVCYGTKRDGSILAPFAIYNCEEIDSSGYYMLQNDVDTEGTCFNITVDNVTLDLNGKTIIGRGDENYFGVYSSGRRNLTITNGIVISFENSGIYFVNVRYSFINNLNLTLNGNGNYISGGYNNALTNIHASLNNITGINITHSDNNSLSNIIANYNAYSGISLFSSDNNYLSNITVNSNFFGLSSISAPVNNSLLNVIANYNTYTGIYLLGARNHTLLNITANYNPTGLYFNSGSRNNIISNLITNNNSANGITFSSSFNNSFLNLSANFNYKNGVYFSSSTNNTFKDSYVCNNAITDFNCTNILNINFGTNIISSNYAGCPINLTADAIACP